jgi:hypothetical protein
MRRAYASGQCYSAASHEGNVRQRWAIPSRPSHKPSALAWAPTRTGDVDLSVVDDHGDMIARTIRVAVIP